MHRRAFMRLGGFAGAFLLSGTPFTLFAKSVTLGLPSPIERLFVAMGTVIRIQVYHEDERAARDAIREASSLIQELHDRMSVQSPRSEIAIWNQSNYGTEVPFSKHTTAAIDEAFRLGTLTDGRLDPTVGAAVIAYETGRRVPPQTERLVGWDPENRVLSKTDPSIRIDLGGSAKGWAVDRAADVLLRHGIEAALINAGGDLRVIGAPPGNDSWKIGIRDAWRNDEILGVIELRDAAIATSGDYEKAGSILIDPRDLSRVLLDGSVSVVAPTCGAADGLATALSIEPDLCLLPGDVAGLTAYGTANGPIIETTPNFNLRPSADLIGSVDLK